MQLTIWNDYLKNLKNKMHLENRNILLLVDNVPTHNLMDNLELTNVKIKDGSAIAAVYEN